MGKSALDTPCEQCGHPLRQHYDGICGARDCSVWMEFLDSRCPDAVARGRGGSSLAAVSADVGTND